MGGVLAAVKLTNQQVAAGNNFPRTRSVDSKVHLIITALDYKKTKNPLTCTKDGRNMQKLAEACQIEDVHIMYDEQCTKEAVKERIEMVGRQCRSGDFFIFYYSGHGVNMKDQSGDEKDGEDEAFCFVTPDGEITFESCMVDDDFSQCLLESVPDDVQIVILTDCCHSGTIADLDSPSWGARKAVSITGCLDNQTSGDMGRGGIFTHSMLLAIAKLKQAGEVQYSVGALFNATLSEDNRVFNSAQDITIQCSAGVSPDGMEWPLVPAIPYRAPLSHAAEAAGGGSVSGTDLQQATELCQALGINPSQLQYVTGAVINTLPDNYQAAIRPMMPTFFAVLTVAVKKICG